MPICLETKRSKYLSLNIVSYFCNGTIFSGRFLPLIIELIINVGTWRCNEMRNKLCTDFEDSLSSKSQRRDSPSFSRGHLEAISTCALSLVSF